MDFAIRVLVYEPGKVGEIREIPDTLEAIQEIVGGFFEVVFNDDVGITMLVNDNADALPVNRRFGLHKVRGPVLFTRSDSQGRTAGLSGEDVERIRALYG